MSLWILTLAKETQGRRKNCQLRSSHLDSEKCVLFTEVRLKQMH